MKLNFNIQNYLIFSLNYKFKINSCYSYKLFYGIRQNKYIINIIFFLYHLKRTLSHVNQENHNNWFSMAIWTPDEFELVKDIASEDLEEAYTAIDQTFTTYEQVSAYLQSFKAMVEANEYGIVKTK